MGWQKYYDQRLTGTWLPTSSMNKSSVFTNSAFTEPILQHNQSDYENCPYDEQYTLIKKDVDQESNFFYKGIGNI